MTKHAATLGSLALCLLALTAADVQATNSIKNNWNTYYGATACANVKAAANACSLCHTPSNPYTMNPYGDLLIDNGRNFAAAATVDVDGDGRTNGQEITQDCTLPGDVASPADLPTWGALKAAYR